MTHVLASLTRATLATALALGLALPSAHAFDSGSTGADGAFNPTVSTEIQLPESGILNYTSVNVPAGVTVKFRKNSANTPVYLLASGDVTIAGTIDVTGEDARPTGTYGDGNLGDDGIPGDSGPGGFAGGRGGRDDQQLRPAIIRGGAGLGPGGGAGGLEGNDGCNTTTGYWKYVGTGGAYASPVYRPSVSNYCGYQYGAASRPYGASVLQPLVGGSGGGGGRGGANYPGSGGGGGGGAILIASSGTLRVTGTINARGGDGGGLAGTNAGGQGAGGSGGAIRLIGSRVEGAGALYAEGGCINFNNNRRQRCGTNGYTTEFGGSEGRIRIEGDAITFSGTSSPAYVSDTPGAVFIADAPTLRIATVAGQPVPQTTTGMADVVLPASASEGPMEIGFQTSNVPLGNLVKLRAVPAYGSVVEVESPGIGGSEAEGTAVASITLPAGPSTLQATTTYTIVVAALNDSGLEARLAGLAHNERVEKVEVTVALEGAATATLITASGKHYELPYAALAAAGFRG